MVGGSRCLWACERKLAGFFVEIASNGAYPHRDTTHSVQPVRLRSAFRLPKPRNSRVVGQSPLQSRQSLL